MVISVTVPCIWNLIEMEIYFVVVMDTLVIGYLDDLNFGTARRVVGGGPSDS